MAGRSPLIIENSLSIDQSIVAIDPELEISNFEDIIHEQ